MYVLLVLKSSLSHDEMVMVSNVIFRSVMDYACQAFIYPGKRLDIQLTRMCKRAFNVIHCDNDCEKCNLCSVVERGFMLSTCMRLFKSDKTTTIIIHPACFAAKKIGTM